jgi:hypothetical protein
MRTAVTCRLTWCALLGICDRRIVASFPRISLHLRQVRGASAEPKTLGEHLRLKRIDVGLTQPQISVKLGVGWQSIAQLPTNPPRVRAKIVAFLGYDPEASAVTQAVDARPCWEFVSGSFSFGAKRCAGSRKWPSACSRQSNAARWRTRCDSGTVRGTLSPRIHGLEWEGEEQPDRGDAECARVLE